MKRALLILAITLTACGDSSLTAPVRERPVDVPSRPTTPSLVSTLVVPCFELPACPDHVQPDSIARVP